jgi:hypothetical protein
LGTTQFNVEQLLTADVNADGMVNIVDIIQIVNHIMNNTNMTPEQGQQIIDDVEDLIDEEIQEPIIDVPVIKPKPFRPDRPRRPIRPGDSVRDIDPG